MYATKAAMSRVCLSAPKHIKFNVQSGEQQWEGLLLTVL